MKRFRILVADSHDVVRRSIRATLEEQLSWLVVGETKTGPETIARVLELRPDAAVVDIGLPDVSGVEVTREIVRMAPEVGVIMLTMHVSRNLAQRVHEAGARAYIPKTDVGRRLVDLLQNWIERRTNGAPAKPRTSESALTGREREVLHLLAEGQSNKEIGAALAISAKTVETHRARIMSKLHLRSVGQLVRYAIRTGIIIP